MPEQKQNVLKESSLAGPFHIPQNNGLGDVANSAMVYWTAVGLKLVFDRVLHQNSAAYRPT